MRRANCILGCWETIETSFVISNKYKTINPSSVKVYLYLVCEIGQMKSAILTQFDITSKCGMSDRTVNRSVKELVELGLVHVENQFREDGGQMPNKYWLTAFNGREDEDEI